MRNTDTEPSTHTASDEPARWGDLFAPAYRIHIAVAAGGIFLYAMNLYFTAALMPSVIDGIGGQQYFAWAATAYLITAVIATMVAGRLIGTRGIGRSYVAAFLLFGAGTSLCALAPTMEWFIAGRAVQGFGAGLLAALCYGVIRSVLPERLWTLATGVITSMFALGALFGPAIGGVFGELDAWRLAFWVLVAAAIALLLMVLRAVPLGAPETPDRTPLPALPIALLTASAALLSISQMTTGGWVIMCITLGIALLIAFIIADARGRSGIYPRATYQRGEPVKWVYLTVVAFAATVMSEYFIPDIGQNLAGLGPLLAGFLGAVMSLGWTASQLRSIKARPSQVRTLVRVGPVVVLLGVGGFGLLLTESAAPTTSIIWALLLTLAGLGIGLAFPHLSVLALKSGSDDIEGAKAAAAIGTTQLIAFTLTSALAGNLMTLGDSALSSARWVIGGIWVIAAFGVVTAALATRRAPHHAPRD